MQSTTTVQMLMNYGFQRVYVDQGSTLKRMRARAKGRGTRILKPTCHITVKVSDEERKKVSGKEKK